jgi:hypothetical protein
MAVTKMACPPAFKFDMKEVKIERYLLPLETYQAAENSNYPEHIDTLSTGALTRIPLLFPPPSQPNPQKLRHLMLARFDMGIISAIFQEDVITASFGKLERIDLHLISSYK